VYRSCARLLGCVDARIAALGGSRDRIDEPEYDRVLTVLRDTLGSDELATLRAEGAAMTQEQVIDVGRSI
jgi:hypothetical protein